MTVSQPRRFLFYALLLLIVIGLPLKSFCQFPEDEPPDLVISSLSAELVAPDRVAYSFKITNVGGLPVSLDGPTAVEHDNVSVQAYVSKDTVYRNEDDKPAGGTILGRSPLGKLMPGESRTGSFTASMRGEVKKYPYLCLMLDHGGVVAESNEDNNIAVVGIGRAAQKAKPQVEEGVKPAK